jgi:nucleotide-binding universal stress UspA family protein
MAHAGRLDSAAMTDSEQAALAASVVCVVAASDLDPSLIARAVRGACRARLERAVVAAAPRAQSVTCTMFDTAQALAEVVRDEGADVLVVGARRRWFEWWCGATTSDRVVDEASCSVLLVTLAPLEAEKGTCSWS